MQSPKRRRHRRSHPPLSMLSSNPRETNEKEHALKKQITTSISGTDMAVNKADRRKGIKTAFGRPTIDTAQNIAPRIKETASLLEITYQITPQSKPRNQKIARTNGISLRALGNKQMLFLRINRNPQKPQASNKSPLMKNGRSIRRLIENIKKTMRSYYTPFLIEIQAFLPKIAFFVNNDG